MPLDTHITKSAAPPGKIPAGNVNAGAFDSVYNVGRLFPVQFAHARNVTNIGPDTRQIFNQLTADWKSATAFSSSVSDIFMHESYQKIIGLGPAAVPLILEDLEKQPDHWYWALAAITRENPAAGAPPGDIKAISKAWISWGKRAGAQNFHAGFLP